ncbi:MAG: NAD(P)-dependent dehydrogenase (short-subunit alcohol dehydrogenase family) [Planctomycetaceae bacterium]|jgi:NAD(P)-dependent dehydrogenase (short-subunit alcohol dehydrogenase family)
MSDARVVVVTGATRGLGRAMAARLIEEGHTVVGCGRSLSGIKELESAFDGPHRFDSVDVVDDAQVAEWAESVISQLGPPDLLLNNAATVNPNAPVWEVSADDFNNVIDVNIKGVANVLRHFVPSMVERSSGIIVNFSSGWGRSTSPEVGPYCATKWAIEGLTQSLAQELPDGMAAIPLNPGIINTELLQSCFGSGAAHYPDPDEWSHYAVPYILGIRPSQNGQSLSVTP